MEDRRTCFRDNRAETDETLLDTLVVLSRSGESSHAIGTNGKRDVGGWRAYE